MNKTSLRLKVFIRGDKLLDNSPMENFFAVTKNEMFYGYEYEFQTLEQLEEAINDYINYYNIERLIVKTIELSLILYRQQSLNQLGR